MELNADETLAQHPDESLLARVMDDLQLGSLSEMPVSQLSNGQTRRARIAKALLEMPELLLLDGPFMGLDPMARELLSDLLLRLADARNPRVLLSLKPDEDIPEWITHVALIDQNYKLDSQGPRDLVFEDLQRREAEVRARVSSTHSTQATPDMLALLNLAKHLHRHTKKGKKTRLSTLRSLDRRWKLREKDLAGTPKKAISSGEAEETNTDDVDKTRSAAYETISRDAFPPLDTRRSTVGSPVIELAGVQVRYGNNIVLGDWKNHSPKRTKGLYWTVRRGERWGVFGPNGSGKTTLLSLLTSDHPQTYSLPVKVFGRTRLPGPGQPGLSIFDLQSRIGHSSPEVHAFFPKTVSVRRTIESAWADTPLSKPCLTHEIDEKVSACLRWFQAEIHPSLGPRPWMTREMMRAPSVDQKWVEFDDKAAPLPGQGFRYKCQRDSGKPLSFGRLTMVKTYEEMEADCLDPHDLAWADEMKFGEMSFSAQRVLLFLRAIIKNPELVVLDEAFSGMDDWARDKCLLFLSHGETMTFRFVRAGPYMHVLRSDGPKPMRSDMERLGRVKVGGLMENQALIVVSHKKEEVPGCVREWLTLPEAGTGMAARTGRLSGPLELSWNGWRTIWGPPTRKSERKLELE
jgi:ABC-type molybdenum transport system ATPase subunit/photorepair protein PhrA